MTSPDRATDALLQRIREAVICISTFAAHPGGTAPPRDDGARFADVAASLGVLAAVTAGLGSLAVVLLRRSLSR